MRLTKCQLQIYQLGKQFSDQRDKAIIIRREQPHTFRFLARFMDGCTSCRTDTQASTVFDLQ